MSNWSKSITQTQDLITSGIEYLLQNNSETQHIYIYCKSLATLAIQELEVLWATRPQTPISFETLCATQMMIHHVLFVMHKAKGMLLPCQFQMSDIVSDIVLLNTIMELDLKLIANKITHVFYSI